VKTRWRAIVVAVAVLGSWNSTFAGDQGGVSFQSTLEPIRINAQAGDVVTRQFRLTLDANQRDTRFKARIEDWWRSEDGAQSFYAEPGRLRHSCGRWVALNPVDAQVKPGETLTIRVTVSVPSEMAAGGYWCALTVDQVPDPIASAEGIGVQFVASVSTGIFVNVGAVEARARIVDLGITDDRAFVKLRNEGNVPVGVDGRLEFIPQGSESPTVTVTIPRSTVLTEPSPEAQLGAPLPPAAQLPSGHYRVRAVLDYGAPFYLGAERNVDLRRVADPGSR
jgi:hypothetical protein